MTAVQRLEEAPSTLGRNLPSLSARGLYTRSQFAAIFPVMTTPTAEPQTFTIQPFNQWDLFLQADAPLVDLAGWTRARAAYWTSEAAQHDSRATSLDVQRQVARSYFSLVGAEAVQRSAARTLSTAEANADLTIERRAAGAASEVDVERAKAEVERPKQSISDAELQAELARRATVTLTGVTPAEGPARTDDNLHEEAPLDQWQAVSESSSPRLAAADAQVHGAALTARAAKLTLIPTLSASFFERFTNTPGFIGRAQFFRFALDLIWRFDFSSIATIRSQDAAAQIALLRQERTKRAVHDQIFEAWQRVRTGIANSNAARAQAKAAHLAAQFATDRHAGGAGTQLDLIQAQRDAFSAEVGCLQEAADLSYARALLPLSAGVPLDKDRP